MRERIRIAKIMTAAAMAASLLASCGKADQANEAPKHTAADVSRTHVANVNEFALRLAKPLLSEAAQENRNAAFSPLSVAFALAMAANGAQGETKAEMMKLLAPDGEALDALNANNEALAEVLEHADKQVTFRVADSLWTNGDIGLLSDYASRMKAMYDAPVRELDFKDAGAAGKVNGWIDKQTDGKIKAIIDAETMATAEALLVNAIYFHGKWQHPFDPKLTQVASFHLTEDTMIDVPMMNMREELNVKRAATYNAVKLPYGSGKWSMILALPKRGVPLAEAESALLGDDAAGWTEAFHNEEATLQVPKFNFEASYLLNDTLSALGMQRALDPDRADFSGITQEKSLFISKVLHKAVVEVDEEGTEAAAATVVVMDDAGVVASEPFVFKADRPFCFAIINDETGTIAFLGAVANPGE